MRGFWRTLFWVFGLALASIVIAVVYTVATYQPMRKFQLRTTDGITYSGYGTEIRGTGFCTELVKRGVVTTRVCQPHMVVEIYDEQPKDEPAEVVPTVIAKR